MKSKCALTYFVNILCKAQKENWFSLPTFYFWLPVLIMSKNHSNTPETLFIGKNVISLESVDSTNRYAKDLLATKKPIEGTLISTFDQTQGRGQLGNIWQAKAGENITVSYILYPDFLLPNEQFYLNIVVSLAVREFCEIFCDNPFVKWPNDIITGSKKLAGILIENSLTFSAIQSSIIGIGININQKNFGEKLQQATSFSLQNDGQQFEIAELLPHLSAALEKYYFLLRQKEFSQLKECYLNALWRYNEKAFFKQNGTLFEGTIYDITREGKLCLQVGEKNEQYSFKEVEFVY